MKDKYRTATFRISSAANFTAGYNLAITGHILFFLDAAGNSGNATQTSLIASASLFGAVVGQFSFGALGRRIGLEKGLVIALCFCIFGNIVSALFSHGSALHLILALGRFLVGVGSGGIYPLSAVASAEATTEETRGKRMMTVFSFQAIAQLFTPILVLFLDYFFANPALSWRALLMFGSVPAALILPLALRLSKYRANHQLKKPERIQANGVQTSAFTSQNLNLLIGTGGTWFLFDFVFYGNVTFTPFMLQSVFGELDAIKTAEYSIIIYLVALPGIYLAAFISDESGRKNLQCLGFFACGCLLLSLAAFHQFLSENISFVLYIATFFFYNFGPNATTFCLPAETFSKEHRSLFNGISAACGKIGAVVGAGFFKAILDSHGLGATFFVCSMSCFVGMILTLLYVVESKGMDEVCQEEILSESSDVDNNEEEIELSTFI